MISDLPPKIWLPAKPAIIRPAPIQKANFLPGMFPSGAFAGAAGAVAQETGFTLVGTGATVNTGAGAWSDPQDITADDNNPAFAVAGSGVGGTPTDTLRGSNCGFAIPTDATIDGIELRVRCSYDVFISGTGTISSVNIGKDNSTLATAKTPGTPLAGSYADYTFGSASDLWGLAWTPAEINASTFQGLLVTSITGGTGVANLCDAMWINIHYTA